MKIEVDTVKGFQDYLPPESQKRDAVKKVIEKWYRLYGFLPIETPVVEFDELMKPESMPSDEEDEAVSDRFRLKDRAGRNLGLRYEFTFQLARILKQNPNLKMPFKRYQVGPVFRDEPTGTSRFRQFIQCDADIVGDSSVSADSECLIMVSDILRELKIDSEINVNNRKLLNAIIESVEIQNKLGVMKELDKLDKIGEDNVKANLKKMADANQIVTLFKLMEKNLEFFRENKFDGADELNELIKTCSKSGLKIKFSPFMIRGFAYYTGNVFEVKVPGKSSIAAGGRYDKTVGKYLMKEIPAVGISFGLERVTELAKIRPSNTKAIIISISQDAEAQKLARKLRKEDIPCIIINDKPGKCMEYADSYNIPFAIFVGKDELALKKFKLRNLNSGEERLLAEKSIIRELKQIL
jgi:histidyl-tRNA synthetase